MKTMFAITHIGRDGLRCLSFPNQGRHHYPTKWEAEKALLEFKGPQGLPKVLTPEQVVTLEVRPVECYDHGDATGIFWD
jgi:hypothetical protein